MWHQASALVRLVARPLVLALLPLVVVPAAPQQPSPDLDEVLGLARQAVSRYGSEAPLMLADERCEQKAFEFRSDGGFGVFRQPRGRRRWQAEIAVVPTPELSAAGYPWTEFRDVIAVDGRPVPDRQERLSRLLLGTRDVPLERAEAIVSQGARFNLGPDRNINTPSVPLLILHAVNAHRFAFSRTGDGTLDGLKVWKVGFHERVSPTLIRNGTRDCAAVGTFWIAPGTGEVLKADFECREGNWGSTHITVKYRRWERGALRVPAELVEGPPDTGLGTYKLAVDSKCQYSNYRRFETGARLIRRHE